MKEFVNEKISDNRAPQKSNSQDKLLSYVLEGAVGKRKL